MGVVVLVRPILGQLDFTKNQMTEISIRTEISRFPIRPSSFSVLFPATSEHVLYLWMQQAAKRTQGSLFGETEVLLKRGCGRIRCCWQCSSEDDAESNHTRS